jgi:uncharacterized phage-associated protein
MREIINEEKLINAILFFLNYEGMRYMSKTKLYKLLYFADFKYFKEHGRSITGLKYYAWKFGPVPITLKNSISKSNSYVALKPFNPGKLNQAEIQICNYIADIFKTSTAKEITQLSHKEGKPWSIARENLERSEIDYFLLFDDPELEPNKKKAIELNKMIAIADDFINGRF